MANQRPFPRCIRRWPSAVAGILVLGQLLATTRAAAADHFLGISDLVVSADSETMFVACSNTNQVLIVNLRSREIRHRLGVPSRPTGLALTTDQRRLIVTCGAAESTVLVIDTQQPKVLQNIPVGHTAMSPALSPDDSQLYVCNRFDNNISVIDLMEGMETARVPVVREPVAAEITPDGRLLVVANHLLQMPAGGRPLESVAAEVTIVDTQTWETTSLELHNGASSLRDICVSKDGSLALVTHILSNFENVPFRLDMGWVNVNVVSVIDLEQRRVSRTIGLDQMDFGASNPWGICFARDGEFVATSIAGNHEIGLIRSSELLGEKARRTMAPIPGAWPVYPSLGENLWQRISLPGRGPRAICSSKSKLFIAEYFTNSVAVIDLTVADQPQVDQIQLAPTDQLSLERRGEMLFNDATICYQQWQSCASCHPDGRADGLNWDLMNDGVGNPKNTKSILLSHETPPAMAVGVRATAEVAVRSGLSHILFARRPEQEAEAMDAYLRSLRPTPSPHLVDGQLSASAERGQVLFHSRRTGCARCHKSPYFTDLKRHKITSSDSGQSMPEFDTPTLIEVWRTAPYLHDGRYVTLRELLLTGQHGLTQRQVDDLDPEEIDDLIEYVLSL
jgi:YVTN family beta-propeller protein